MPVAGSGFEPAYNAQAAVDASSMLIVDPARSHRVRCELDARLPGRHQFMVHAAHKEALIAISGAFAGARKQLRRLATRGLGTVLHPPIAPSGEMQDRDT